MNYGIIRYVCGWSIAAVSAFMLMPALYGGITGEREAWAFVICAAVFFLAGRLLCRRKPRNGVFYAKEGFAAVTLTWVVISLISAVPFVLGGAIRNPVDALFETVSGFTTTGSSILRDVEVLPRCMLLWRSFTHWLGGMGVLVFVLALLPSADGQNMYFMRAESPGPDVGKLVPGTRRTAVFLYVIYSVLTVAEFVLLVCGSMPVFDACCITFGTAGTGGFGVLNSSCADYTSYQKVVITVFMLLFGVNFNVYFLLLRRKWKEALSGAELRVYLTVYFVAAGLISLQLWRVNGHTSFLDAAFQTASVMTTTGYSTTDFNLWPLFSKVMLVGLMFIGASAGSTGGGMKVSRFIIYGKVAGREFSRMLHPRRVKILTVDGEPLEHKTINSALTYLVCYLAVFAGSVLLISLDCDDFSTAFTSVAATLNNIGPGLGEVGPAGNFADFSVFSKFVFMLDMLAGRLEIFPLLLSFLPDAWRN